MCDGYPLRPDPLIPRRSLLLGLTGLALLMGSLAQGSAPVPDPLAAQRRLFLAAEQALERGDQGRYAELRGRLTDYPLVPYLDHLALGKAPGRRAAEDFLERYPDGPLGRRVRRDLVEHLAGAEDWQGVLDTYRPDGALAQRCHYLTALWQQGRAEEALGEVDRLWRSAEADPKACERLFAEWRRRGRLTTEGVWQRIGLALAQGNQVLASDLEPHLPAADRPWLRLWLRAQRDPGRLYEGIQPLGPHSQRAHILVEGIKRLANQDPAAAAALRGLLEGEEGLTAAERCTADSALALGRARSGAGAAEALAELDALGACLTSTRQREERLRAALRARDWGRLGCWIQTLPEAERQEEAWRYWHARALEALGDLEVATFIWEDLAQQRSYYGFLAADRLTQPYRLGHRPLQMDPEVAGRLSALDGTRRAKELLALERTAAARREWQQLIDNLAPAELQAAALLAQGWGWHDQTILTLARAEDWDDLELRFPLAHQVPVAEAAAQHQLDPAWIYAVLRQESAFAADLRSTAGAIGLMQLLPATAKEVAREGGQGPITPSALTQPGLNIALGSAYLAKLNRRLGGHAVLATAAYNGGPARVAGWLPREPQEADLWVELIPLRETRQYVQRVLTYQVIYRHRLGEEPQPLGRMMAPIPPDPRLANPKADGGDGTVPPS